MKNTKKILSVFLALCTFLTMFYALSVSVSASPLKTPVIYVPGQGTPIYNDKYKKDVNLYTQSTAFPADFAKELVSKLIEPLKTGIFKDDWSDYCDVLCDALDPYFSPLALDDDGNAKGNSGFDSKTTAYDSPGGYNINSYIWHYDWRLDPAETAEKLHTYVLAVKKATNSSRVDLISRCLSVNVFLSYVRKYGATDFNKVILYSGGFYGFEAIGAFFAGDFSIKGRAVDRFCACYFSGDKYENNEIYSVLKAAVTVLAKTGIIDNAAYWVERAYNQMAGELMPRLLMGSYGTFPGFWSMVGEKYFENAKKLNFSGKKTRYKNLIEKIDDYHLNTYAHTEELMNRAISDGALIHILTKYGLEAAPISKDFSNMQSDDMLSAYSSSYGATCSGVIGKFNKAYMKAAEMNGTSKYIGADRQIDASTCFLPNHTWFLKNLTHKNMPNCVNPLLEAILNSDGYMSVFDNEAFPQYLVIDDNATEMKPLTKENGDTQNKALTKFFSSLRTLIKYFNKIIRDFFNKKLGKG